MNNVKIIELKEHTNRAVSLLVQIILLEMIIVFGVVMIFEPSLNKVLYTLIGLIMFSMAYNNFKFYKKNYMTAIYIIFGIFIIINTFFGII